MVDNATPMLDTAPDAVRTPHPMEALYRAHYGFVWHAVRRFGVAGALMDDAVQDTFITAYRRFDELAMPTAKAWLYGIARRVASNYRRAEQRGARKRRAMAVASEAAPPRSATPEAILVLDRFLAALDPVDRELFVLSEIEGMTGPEAAAILALNTSTTYSRVQSLRRRFRESLAERDPSGVVHEAREQRPRATTHGWMLLLPRLGLPNAAKPAALLGLATVAKVAAIAGGVTFAIGAAFAATGSREADVPAAARESVSRATPAPAEAGLVVATPATLPVGPEPAPRHTANPARLPPAATPSRAAPRAAARVESVPSLTRDNALLQDATRALRDGDAEAALAITTQAARELPDSPLADARAALRIEALCALGKSAQARGEARVLLDTRPATPVRARIERSCVDGSVDSAASGQEGER